MSYNTFFNGAFSFNKLVDNYLTEYINNFSHIRHMKRDNAKIKSIFPNWSEYCYNGKLGIEGEFFIGGKDYDISAIFGDPDGSVIDMNKPSKKCPGTWCQWEIKDDKLKSSAMCIIEDDRKNWDCGEKFRFIEWLKYLIKTFFAPNDYILGGRIEFKGNDEDDRGYIEIIDNEVFLIFHH